MNARRSMRFMLAIRYCSCSASVAADSALALAPLRVSTSLAIERSLVYKGTAEVALALSEIPMAPTVSDWEHRLAQRFKLRDLHILATVVRWGSMAQAAKHLSMSQPAISESIATLESTLRVKLLDRSPSGVEPTIYANALLKRGAAVFDELLQGIRDIESLADPSAGEVRVGCPETLTAGLLP